MKKLLFIVPLLIAFGCSKSVEEETLIEKDGLKYLPDAEIPYTGPVISLNDKGKKRSDGHYKEGKREGLFGVKMESQFGKLSLSTIIGREKVQKESGSLGQQSDGLDRYDYSFVKDKYFFIDKIFLQVNR